MSRGLICLLIAVAVAVSLSAAASAGSIPATASSASCHLSTHDERHLGASYVTSLKVSGTSYAKGKSITLALNRCRTSSGKPKHFALLGAVATLAYAGAVGVDTVPASSGHAPASVQKPPIRKWLIPFSPKRKREMAAYSERHYGEHTWRLRHPGVIVEHVAVASTAEAVFESFAPDVPDVELGELPNVCAHFVVSSAGRIYRLVNTRTRCRHTVGLNWTAIGIEHAGFTDGGVLGNRRQMHASLRLTQHLRCHFGIKLSNVIGHAESLTSPYHRELVPSLRNQTHGDWRHSSMRVYRKRLRHHLGRC